jgi:hypothetical protein
MARQKFLSMAALLLVAAAGCHGTIGNGSEDTTGGNTGPGAGPGKGGSGNPMTGPGTGGSTGAGNRGGGTATGGMGPSTGGPMGSTADQAAAGPMPLRRLTHREYNNTIRDLLGDAGNRADNFPADKDPEFTFFKRSGIVSSQDADTIKDAAEATANAIAAKVAMLAPCVGMAEDACASKFIADFGLRAYRRPLATDETQRLTDLYKTGRNTLMLNYGQAIQLLVEGMLQSPNFLYLWELGNAAPAVEGKVVRLNHYENASRLSYALWGSMPDAALFDAAKNGKLGTQAELQDQARRMLTDARGRDNVYAFVEEWLQLDLLATRPKDGAVYPDWNDALAGSMTAELKAFVANIVFDGDGKFSSLLTGTNTFVNQPLAALYGMRGITGMAMTPGTLDGTQRSGLLTRAGFMAVTGAPNASHPIKRGHKIYERLLCETLPPPPNNVPPTDPPTASGTTRQHVEKHDQLACAKGCHMLMDPLGFPFEHYDGIGKFRTMDNGQPVDSSSAFELDGVKKTFNDARDLSAALAGSAQVAQCLATQFLRYSFKRADTESDRASLESVDAAFAKGNSITDLMVGLVGSRSFRYRMPADGEKLQ